MDFCIISPTAGLERYATLSKTHLVLPYIHGDYTRFYRKRRDEGDFIILDNGAYEGVRFCEDTFISSIGFYEPQVAVLPDHFLRSWRETWHHAMYFLDRYYDDYPNVEWCYIPQAEKGDLHGFMESFNEVASDPRITWIGIPRALNYAITNNPLARVEFARMVRQDYPRFKLHCFGMSNGDVHEIPYLEQAGVNSIDSSAPVWRGWNGYSLASAANPTEWDRHGIPVNFSAEMHNPLLTCLIHNNLEACGVRIPTRK